MHDHKNFNGLQIDGNRLKASLLLLSLSMEDRAHICCGLMFLKKRFSFRNLFWTSTHFVLLSLHSADLFLQKLEHLSI